MNKVNNSKWFAKLLALFFALLLFFNANSEKRMQHLPTDTSLSATTEKVPIKLNYDENKYFVSGYEETTTVYLKSANKVLLDIESDPNTRNFQVEADLTKYKEGTFEVPLKVVNLNNAVEGTLKNKTIHVTVEKRLTKTFSVTPKINEDLLKKGYKIGSVSVDPPNIDITAGRSILDSIEEVVAPIDDLRNIDNNTSKKVDVIALDKMKNRLSIIAVPTTVTVTIQVEMPSKEIPLVLSQKGTLGEGVEKYNFEILQENVKISGPLNLIDPLTSLAVEVNVNRIQEETTQTLRLHAPSGILVDPTSVEVKIIPVFKEKETKTEETSKPKPNKSESKESTSSQSESSNSSDETDSQVPSAETSTEEE
ncbi:CdaR family protein [Vagococcus humatus]|uniref:YbbR-like domain-containing protein n=1 Tax=Vagococcus humatus TaxID=1889241 RepID=A0A3S0GES1_9ENTE|nr:CdaR family protein [Vagococcus humatus]RST90075.1 hypothetical protein C7P63_03070 [Vagococcus humatus]